MRIKNKSKLYPAGLTLHYEVTKRVFQKTFFFILLIILDQSCAFMCKATTKNMKYTVFIA